ncbi:hypothetical protein E5O15_25225 (plasmid) [Salmonella enterica subsp. enterica serovar 1,4,[5],12:i:-]|nr:hypothetical protein E5O15_25225 [Salmonella enterica subsp. enterica serovar 1,4,[5],12:i:-]
MTSTLDPSHKQIEMWRRATGSEGGLDEYRNWVLENSMRFTAYGIRHCCKVSDEAAFCLIQRPYISKTLLTRRISPRGSP